MPIPCPSAGCPGPMHTVSTWSEPGDGGHGRRIWGAATAYLGEAPMRLRNRRCRTCGYTTLAAEVLLDPAALAPVLSSLPRMARGHSTAERICAELRGYPILRAQTVQMHIGCGRTTAGEALRTPHRRGILHRLSYRGTSPGGPVRTRVAYHWADR